MAALGDREVSEITPVEIESLLDAMAASGASPRTVNKRRALLLAVFNCGMRRAGLATNPVRATFARVALIPDIGVHFGNGEP